MAAEDLSGAVAVHLLGPEIPTRDDPRERLADDGVL
jgi:hypothetical protein